MAQRLPSIVWPVRSEGDSPRAIVEALNRRGVKSPRADLASIINCQALVANRLFIGGKFVGTAARVMVAAVPLACPIRLHAVMKNIYGCSHAFRISVYSNANNHLDLLRCP
jgi:hypothetical protein